MEEPRYLELSIDDCLLRMWKLTSNESQKILSPPSVEYTVTGAATIRGAASVPRFMWSVTALLEEDEADLLAGMYALQDRKRRLIQPFGILMSDTTRRFSQPLPATRSVVSGTTPVVQGSIVSYYAVFSVVLTPPEFTANGKYFSTSFTAMELENVA